MAQTWRLAQSLGDGADACLSMTHAPLLVMQRHSVQQEGALSVAIAVCVHDSVKKEHMPLCIQTIQWHQQEIAQSLADSANTCLRMAHAFICDAAASWGARKHTAIRVCT